MQLKSGGDHSDPELAVRVRQGTLRYSACSRGPAEEKEKEKEKEEKEKEKGKEKETEKEKAGQLT